MTPAPTGPDLAPFHSLPQVRGGGEALNRGCRPWTLSQVRCNRWGRWLGRLVGSGGDQLLYLAVITVTHPSQPFFHSLLQVRGGGGAPNRGRRPWTSPQVRYNHSGSWLGRLVGRGGGQLLYLVVL